MSAGEFVLEHVARCKIYAVSMDLQLEIRHKMKRSERGSKSGVNGSHEKSFLKNLSDASASRNNTCTSGRASSTDHLNQSCHSSFQAVSLGAPTAGRWREYL